MFPTAVVEEHLRKHQGRQADLLRLLAVIFPSKPTEEEAEVMGLVTGEQAEAAAVLAPTALMQVVLHQAEGAAQIYKAPRRVIA